MFCISEPDLKMAKRKVREVEVECFQAHADNVWTNVGQATTVQQCQALRPPHHVTGYVRLDPNTSKGVTQTLTNNFIFVVLEGEVSVEINAADFKTTKGDTFYVPSNASYNILNTSQERAELFVIQYKDREEKQFPPGL